MARKVVNRKQLREEAEAAEKAEKAGTKKKKKATKAAKTTKTTKTAKKKATKRASRKKVAVEVRMKLFWGVFSQSLKRVALYEFSQKKDADKKAAQLSSSGKAPHFVQKVKEAIEE